MAGDPDRETESSPTGRRHLGQLLLVAAVVVSLLASASLLAALPGDAMLGMGSFEGVGPGSGGSGAGGSGGATGTATPSTPASTPTDEGDDRQASNLAGGGLIGTQPSDSVGGVGPVTELNGDIVLYVQANRSVRLRAGAFVAYNGRRWFRPTDRAPYSTGEVTDAGETVDGERFAHRIRLEQPTRAVYAAWQPSAVEYPEEYRLEVTAAGGLAVAERPEPPVNYSVLSFRPPDDPARLREATGTPPAAVRGPYTQLPEDTPERLAQKVDEITADAPTTYDKAVAVEDWLEATKNYSLNASHPGDVDHLTDHFVFEMETGYCEYFASAMATMLRTQDVPARLVVGYAPGEQLEEDLYVVRGYHAHAWVEVYFPGTGWVAFDPTPAGHLDAELEKQAAMDPNTIVFPDRYTIELNRTPKPGVPITVTVRNGFQLVEDVPVQFNGRTVGRSGPAGNVTATVPYTRNLTISLGQVGGQARGGPVVSSDRRPAVRSPALGRMTPARSQWNTTLPVNVTIDVSGDPEPGSRVTLTVRVAGNPMPKAVVVRDGSVQGRTNASGQFGLQLPDRPGANVTVAVRRNEITGNTTIRIDQAGPDAPLRLSVASGWPIALPGGPATIGVTANGTPVSGAQVWMAGERIGRTTNGTLATTLPFKGSFSLRATAGGQTAERTVTGLFLNLAILLGVLGLVFVGLVAVVGRRMGLDEALDRTLWARVRGVIRWVTNRIVAGAFWVGAKLAQLKSLLIELVEEGRDGVRKRLRQLQAALATLSLDELLTWLHKLVERLLERGRALGRARSDATEAGEPTDGAAGSGEFSVTEAWRRFVSTVRPPDPRHQTPGDVARYAVRAGLEEGPVRTLTETYREVEYGGRAPSSTITDEVRAALEAVERREEEGED